MQQLQEHPGQVETGSPPPGGPERLLRNRPELILGPLVFLLVIGGWELLVRVMGVPTYILPPPSRIFSALLRGLAAPLGARNGYWLHARYTLSAALMGFALGSALGIALGMILGLSRLAEKIGKPYVVAFQSLPKVAVAPMIVVWFGVGISSKVVICALSTFFPLLINAMNGFKSVDEERIELMNSLAASRWQIFRLVALPSALPFIFAGLDIAIVYAILGAIVGEFVGAEFGLGALILQMNFAMDLAGAFSILIVLSIMGISLSAILNVVRRRILFWAPSERRPVGRSRFTGA